MPILSALQRRLDTAVERAAAAQLAAREQLVSRLDSINNYLSGLGGAGDKGAVARPNVHRHPLDWAELTTLYRFNGYARRFVDIMPFEATRAGWRVLDDSPNGEPTKEADEALGLRDAMAELDTWARLYGGALLVPVLEEDIPPAYRQRPAEWLRQPLDPERVGRVVNLVVLDPHEFAAGQWDADMRSGNFRRPRHWHIAPQTASETGGATLGGYLHHTRALYLGGARLPPSLRARNQGLDDSILQPVWDQLRHKTSSDQGIASLMQEIKLNVVRVEGLASMTTSDQAEYFDLRMRQIARGKSINNLVILDSGEDLQQLSAQVSGMGDLDDRARTALAAVTGMPQVILFGDTPGGLNTDGESHRRIWDKVVVAYQQRHYLPRLRDFYTLLFASQDGPEAPEEWSIEFHSLDEPTDKEQAEVEKLHAEADATRIEFGILPAEHITRSRYGAGGYQHELMPLEESAPTEGPPDFEESGELMEGLRVLSGGETQS